MNCFTSKVSFRRSLGACTAGLIAIVGLVIFAQTASAQTTKNPKKLVKSKGVRELEKNLGPRMAEALFFEAEDKPIIISDGSLSIIAVNGFKQWTLCTPGIGGGQDLVPPVHYLGKEQIYYDDETLGGAGSICQLGVACTVSITYGDEVNAIQIVKDLNTVTRIHTNTIFNGPNYGPLRHWEWLAHGTTNLHITSVSVGGAALKAPTSGKLPALGIDMFVTGGAQACPKQP